MDWLELTLGSEAWWLSVLADLGLALAGAALTGLGFSLRGRRTVEPEICYVEVSVPVPEPSPLARRLLHVLEHGDNASVLGRDELLVAGLRFHLRNGYFDEPNGASDLRVITEAGTLLLDKKLNTRDLEQVMRATRKRHAHETEKGQRQKDEAILAQVKKACGEAETGPQLCSPAKVYHNGTACNSCTVTFSNPC